MATPINDIIRDKFDFLVREFDFKIQKVENLSGGSEFIYLNKMCGVQITYEFREAYLFVTIFKLQQGRLIDNPRPFLLQSKATGVSLDDVIAIKHPGSRMKPVYEYGKNSEFYDEKLGLNRYIAHFAKNLREYGSELLRGDFRIFENIESIMRERSKMKL
jgi:hypothetical protein